MAKIILASQSPRRKQLMEAAEIDFDIVIADVDETNPPGMKGNLVPEYLAKKKAITCRIIEAGASYSAAPQWQQAAMRQHSLPCA